MALQLYLGVGESLRSGRAQAWCFLDFAGRSWCSRLSPACFHGLYSGTSLQELFQRFICHASANLYTEHPLPGSFSGQKCSLLIRREPTMDGLTAPCHGPDSCCRPSLKYRNCWNHLISAVMATTKPGSGWSQRIIFIFPAWCISTALRIFIAEWPQKPWTHLCWRPDGSWLTLHARDVPRACSTLRQPCMERQVDGRIRSLLTWDLYRFVGFKDGLLV